MLRGGSAGSVARRVPRLGAEDPARGIATSLSFTVNADEEGRGAWPYRGGARRRGVPRAGGGGEGGGCPARARRLSGGIKQVRGDGGPEAGRPDPLRAGVCNCGAAAAQRTRVGLGRA